MKNIFIAILIFITCTANAEVYRWTDSAGKVHYTDKKPKANADNITEQVSKQNIDTSTEERKKVGEILRKENDEDRQFYQQQQAQKTQELNKKNKRCNEARQYLKDLKGRVQFIDDKGKPVYVSEQERQRREKEFETVVNKECSN